MKVFSWFAAFFGVGLLVGAVYLERDSAAQGHVIALAIVSLALALICKVCQK